MLLKLHPGGYFYLYSDGYNLTPGLLKYKDDYLNFSRGEDPFAEVNHVKEATPLP